MLQHFVYIFDMARVRCILISGLCYYVSVQFGMLS